MNGGLINWMKYLREMAKNAGDFFPADPRHITKDSVEGIEGYINSSNGQYKLQLWHYANTMYMLMAGNEKKQIVASKDVDRYFKSFTVNKTPASPSNLNGLYLTFPKKLFPFYFHLNQKK